MNTHRIFIILDSLLHCSINIVVSGPRGDIDEDSRRFGGQFVDFEINS